MKLIFLGPPGAGKGTQATGVSAKLAIPHISTGDMFRSAIKNGTSTGLKAKSYMGKGQLVPDSVVIDMVKERISMDDAKNGYLLDGFPRTVDQAVALDKIASPDAVINIEVPDDKLLMRLTGRRVCGKCQGTFHISKLADERVCPICGGELVHREDDKPETIKKRLQVYHDQTAPVIDYYGQNGKLRSVDGDNRPEDVLKVILDRLSAI